jgi:myo-inositol-1(or 4)-monophosphatase
MSTDPAALGEFAVALASGAASLIRDHLGGDLAVTSKSSSTDLVTEVDRASERWLVEQIAQERPDDAVLAEEGGEHAGRSGVRWLLDPIDGTVNFVLGLPQYAVSVAAEVDGRVVAAAVCGPVTGELYRAVIGQGARLESAAGSRRLTGPRRVDLDRAVVGTGFGYDRAQRARQAAIAAELLPLVGDIRRIGSAALDICAVAAGRLDAYYEVGLNPWDYAAGALVAAEAGCAVSGMRGAAPSSRMTAVAGAALVGPFLDLLHRLRADEVG